MAHKHRPERRPEPPEPPDLAARVMVCRDLPRVCQIEAACFAGGEGRVTSGEKMPPATPFPAWTIDNYLAELRRKERIGMLAELLPAAPGRRGLAEFCKTVFAGREPEAAGHIFYHVGGRYFAILRLAVDPRFQRRGIGRALVDLLVRRLSPGKRQAIVATVPESNLAACHFLAACGFRARRIVPAAFAADDGIFFDYRSMRGA